MSTKAESTRSQTQRENAQKKRVSQAKLKSEKTVASPPSSRASAVTRSTRPSRGAMPPRAASA